MAMNAKQTVSYIEEQVKAAQLQLISEIEEALPKTDAGIDPDWPWSKSSHRDEFIEQVRTILATKRGEIES